MKFEITHYIVIPNRDDQKAQTKELRLNLLNIYIGLILLMFQAFKVKKEQNQ